MPIKTNKLFIFASLLACVGLSEAYAATTSGAASAKTACVSKVWMVEGKKLEMCYSQAAKALVSAACIKKTCGVVGFLKEASEMKHEPSTVPSANPGSDVCRKVHGQIQIAYDANRNQMAVCQASDGSMVDLISLSEARK